MNIINKNPKFLSLSRKQYLIAFCSSIFFLVAESALKGKSEVIKPNVFNVSENNRRFGQKSREHIYCKLSFQNADEKNYEALITSLLKELSRYYSTAIKPLEDAYKFNDISNHVVTEGDIFALPKILFVGSWSAGKSSMINYFLGIENTTIALESGAQPSTSDFSILTYGSESKIIDGSVLVMDSQYSSLEKFGHNFLKRLQSIQIPSKILKMVNFIDTPGIIENRKQQERGYPFTDVCQWFIDRSDVIILVFDPTKLDFGMELETLFKQMKNNEAKVRIILNKADTLNSQDLMRVYGALFWSLAPLINITEPPRVYVGSFWSKPFHPVSKEFRHLFLEEEITLLQDIFEVMQNRVQNKISFLRKHAVLVRNHALVVDQYLQALQQHRSIFKDVSEVYHHIIESPEEYKIFHKVLSHQGVSKRDLFSKEDYANFFAIHDLETFLPLSKHCGFIGACLLDMVDYVIHTTLPEILDRFGAITKNMNLQSNECHYDSDKPLNHEKLKYLNSEL